MDDVVAVVDEGTGEADVGRRVHEDVVAFGAEDVQGADNAAEDAVLIADGFRRQALDAVARALPVDDGVKVRVARHEVAKDRMLDTADDRFLDRRHGGEVHIGHPHRDGVKAFLRRAREARLAQGIDRQRILAAAVHDGGKIVGHKGHSFCMLYNEALLSMIRLPLRERKKKAAGLAACDHVIHAIATMLRSHPAFFISYASVPTKFF